MLSSVVAIQGGGGGSQAERDAAQQLGQATRELGRRQGEASRAQAELRSAEQQLARARTDATREAARERLDNARENYQEAQQSVREAEQEVREAQQSVREAAQETQQQVREAEQQAREAAQQAREIAQQVREQAQRIRVEQIQVPVPPVPPDPGEQVIVHVPGGRGPFDGQPHIPQEAVVISIAFFVTMATMVIGWPIARAFGRRVDRKTAAAVAGAAQLPGELNARLERIEHSVDAIAIEVERISEGQRFTAKLLSDMRPMQPIAAGQQKVPELIERK